MSIESLAEWLAAHPPADERFTQSLAGAADRVCDGEELRFAVRELLDELQLLPRSDLIVRAIEDRPRRLADARANAYLGALAEHVAAGAGVGRPSWCVEPDRFLDRFWFPDMPVGFRALALVESPAAFRRRGIFVTSGSLQRV